jgi:coenzyme PQQ synthesis protein D (PqqD)
MNRGMRTRPQVAPSHHASLILRPAARASFSILDGRPVLFSESAQKIYELNQMAAYIWCCLLDRKPKEAICDDLTTFRLDRLSARNHVDEALHSWLALGLLEVDWEASEIHSFAVGVGKLAVNIRTSSERLTQLLIPLFSPGNNVTEKIGDTFEIAEIDGQAHIFHNKSCVARCPVNELAPTLKARITEQIVLKSPPDIALHAACLLSGGKGLLISGHPGAGKTTLAVHLMEAGFGYAADDVALIAPDGRATGVPFAPAIKSGAWAMIEKLRPDLRKSFMHIRPDGRRVKYLNAAHAACNGSVPVGWIIFLRRTSKASPKLAPLGQLETIRRLIDGSYSPDGKLTEQGFSAFKRTLAEAQSFELHYSDAAQARDVIVDLCHG